MLRMRRSLVRSNLRQERREVRGFMFLTLVLVAVCQGVGLKARATTKPVTHNKVKVAAALILTSVLMMDTPRKRK